MAQPDGEQLLDRFDTAWRSGIPPRIDDFLSAAGSRREVLEELIKIDLECRWRRRASGCKALSLADYVAHYPELEPIPLDLIRMEYRVCRYWGDRPTHAEYTARFPHHAARLREALDGVDAELAAEFGSPAHPSQGNPVPQPALAPPLVPATDTAAALPITTIHALIATLRHTQLLTTAQLEEVDRNLAGRLGDTRTLARALLQKDWLTAYQANQLLQGRGADLVLGPYTLLERLGEGGAGQVFKARHQRMNRVVALKVLRKELLDDTDVVSRFYREIQVISKLDSPHIVRAFDAGPIGSMHCLAMEYVEGTDLARLIKQNGPLPVAVACEYIRQAAVGLQHAHERRLTHRDIKPANLLLAKPGLQGTALECVKILDLGLARLRRPPQDQTADNDGTEHPTTITAVNGVVMMGTPDYLAPEQALNFHEADIRADIYSLGCTFYYLLTGGPPFRGGTLAQKLWKHQQAEVPPVVQHRPDVPEALSAVIERMLAKQPEDRYQTPAEVAQALAAVTPLKGTRTGDGSFAAADAGKSKRRRRFVSGAVGMLLVGVLAFVYFHVGSGPREPDQPDTGGAFQVLQAQLADPQVPPAEKLQAILRYRMEHAGTAEAQEAAEHFIKLQTPLDSLQRAQIRPELVTSDLAAEVVAVPYPNLSVSCLAVSPDGAWIAVGEGPSIHLWNVARREEQAVWKGHEPRVRCLAFTPDGKLLASGGDDRNVKLWTASTGAAVDTLPGLRGQVSHLAIAPDGKTLAAGCGPPTSLRLWDLTTRQERRTLSTRQVTSLAFSPDGQSLALTTLGPPDVFFLDAASGKDRGQLSLAHTGCGTLFAVAYTADSQQLVVNGTENQGAKLLYDVAARPDVQAPFKYLNNTAGRYLAWSLDGKCLVAANTTGRIWRWDQPLTQKPPVRPWQLDKTTRFVTLASDGRHLGVVQADRAVYVLRLAPSPK